MYKMIRDTKRQLEDKIGPAVPVCIASGRSPATNKPSRSHPLRIRHALLTNPTFLLLFELRIYIYIYRNTAVTRRMLCLDRLARRPCIKLILEVLEFLGVSLRRIGIKG